MKKLETKEEITAWLDKKHIKNYEVLEDDLYGYIVNVNGPVNLTKKGLKIIPVKFNIVTGAFLCAKNKLRSLMNAPEQVGHDFDCSYNDLNSLEGCPINIPSHFNCSHNNLTSLSHGPNSVFSSYDCSYNQLKTLEFSPMTAGLTFNCSVNDIQSFEFCPLVVELGFYCAGNPSLGHWQEVEDFSQIYEEHLRVDKIINKQKQLAQKIKNLPLIKEEVKKEKL